MIFPKMKLPYTLEATEFKSKGQSLYSQQQMDQISKGSHHMRVAEKPFIFGKQIADCSLLRNERGFC